MSAAKKDVFLDEFRLPDTWTPTNFGRSHRFAGTGIYQLPFGKGRAFWKSGVLNYVFGGWQLSGTYEWQPGPLLDFGNIFYYGDLADIASETRTFDRWFNTANFERTASKGPAAFHVRVFPTRVDGVRADMTNQWNANILRDFRLREGLSLQLRLDALNLQNRSQMAAPSTDPYSTNFGRVTNQTSATNRFLQIQARIRF
jgi:hypothetical protein